MFTNLAIERGPHIVCIVFLWTASKIPQLFPWNPHKKSPNSSQFYHVLPIFEARFEVSRVSGHLISALRHLYPPLAPLVARWQRLRRARKAGGSPWDAERSYWNLVSVRISWSDPPPTNSGIMDFNCNFPAKIAQQPRDQNHKQFERPNLLNPNFSDVEPKYEITLGAAYLEPDQIYSVGACRDFVG